LILGGDHSLATGSISGLLKTYPDLKIIWVDAHGDINTPLISPSGNYHGMPAAHLLNLFPGKVFGFEWFDSIGPFLKKENICYIGLRFYYYEEMLMLKKKIF
jgi:arginase